MLQDFGLEEGDVEADWRQVYAYLSRQLQICNEKTAAQPLDARVMFSDDGSPVPGYPPENSLRRGYGAWCTNSGVETDVDLVLELPEACLITHFEGANGGLFYSAPLREALVFASVHPVGLENARQYNGRMGSEWAEKLSRCHGTATPVKPAEPLVGFCFPPPPEAFNARLKKRLNRPVVARYVHFKLLRSYNAHDGRLSGRSNASKEA